METTREYRIRTRAQNSAYARCKAQLELSSGGITPQRLRHLGMLVEALTNEALERLHIEECQDERTGLRYGRARKRAGCAHKLGSGGRYRGSRYAYQVWAVWA